MSEQQVKRVWLGIAFVMLVATYPTWLAGKQPVSSGYDAPWVYPACNPTVSH